MSNLQIREWLSSLEGQEIRIPSVDSLRQSIIKKHGEIWLKRRENLSIISAVFRARFYLLIKEGGLEIGTIEGYVEPGDLLEFETELTSADLTDMDDSFVMAPSESDLMKHGNLPVNAEGYQCTVEYLGIGNNVVLKIPENGEINLTGNANW